MRDGRGVFAGVLCGLFFESIFVVPTFGFYLLPITIIAIIFAVLPFTMTLLNITLSWLGGFLTMLQWSLVATQGYMVSLAFFIHIISIITISTGIIYYVSSTQKK